MRFAVRHTTWCALGKEGQEDDILDSLFKLLFNINSYPPALLLKRCGGTERDETDHIVTGAGAAVGGSLLCVCDCQSVVEI